MVGNYSSQQARVRGTSRATVQHTLWAQCAGLSFLPMGALDEGAGAGLPFLSFCDGRGGWGQGAEQRGMWAGAVAERKAGGRRGGARVLAVLR
jgi:hypothetical protein